MGPINFNNKKGELRQNREHKGKHCERAKSAAKFSQTYGVSHSIGWAR